MTARARKSKEDFKKYRTALVKEAKAEEKRPRTYLYAYGSIGVKGIRAEIVSAPYKKATMKDMLRRTIKPTPKEPKQDLIPLSNLMEYLFRRAGIYA